MGCALQDATVEKVDVVNRLNFNALTLTVLSFSVEEKRNQQNALNSTVGQVAAQSNQFAVSFN